ncbi:36607_t:CDS:2, partial [Gigaspora margarita]
YENSKITNQAKKSTKIFGDFRLASSFDMGEGFLATDIPESLRKALNELSQNAPKESHFTLDMGEGFLATDVCESPRKALSELSQNAPKKSQMNAESEIQMNAESEIQMNAENKFIKGVTTVTFYVYVLCPQGSEVIVSGVRDWYLDHLTLVLHI